MRCLSCGALIEYRRTHAQQQLELSHLLPGCAMAKTIEQLTAERIERALERVQAAQNELGAAAAELSTLIGGSTRWQRCIKLYDQVHAFWYRVSELRGNKRIRVDGITIEAARRRGELEEVRHG